MANGKRCVSLEKGRPQGAASAASSRQPTSFSSPSPINGVKAISTDFAKKLKQPPLEGTTLHTAWFVRTSGQTGGCRAERAHPKGGSSYFRHTIRGAPITRSHSQSTPTPPKPYESFRATSLG